MKDETEDEIDASWISAHSFQALIINFGSLREYVNGFELPRLKEANIRGRENDWLTSDLSFFSFYPMWP